MKGTDLIARKLRHTYSTTLRLNYKKQSALDCISKVHKTALSSYEADFAVNRGNLSKTVPEVKVVSLENLWRVRNRDGLTFFYNAFLNKEVDELPENGHLVEEVDLHEKVDDKSDSEVSYYDDDAWREEDLVDKIVFDRIKRSNLKEWMKRPARQQVADTRKETAYVEGNFDYNIWFDKYLTDRKEEKEKIPAQHKCNPTLDTGYTKADLKGNDSFFCLFFAKGCCSEGVNCLYFHRVPLIEDCHRIENLRDVFGRARHSTHRTDMGGIGTFTRECKTLLVAGIKMIKKENPIKEMIRILYDNFSLFGEIDDLNYVATLTDK